MISATGIIALAACEPVPELDARTHLARFVEGCIQTAPYFEGGREYFSKAAENPEATGDFLSEYVLPAPIRTKASFVDIDISGDHHLQCLIETAVQGRLPDAQFDVIAKGIAEHVPEDATLNLGCSAASDACEWEWRAGDDVQMMRIARSGAEAADEAPLFYTHYYTTVGFYRDRGS